MRLQDTEALGPPADQQLHHCPARRAALSPTRESPFIFFFLVRFAPELICLLEHFQDNSLNVLHGVQICD